MVAGGGYRKSIGPTAHESQLRTVAQRLAGAVRKGKRELAARRAHRKIGGDGAFKEENASLVGWDDHEILFERIRNYSNKSINVEIRRPIPGHIIYKSLLEPKLHDYQTVEVHTTVPAGKTSDLLFEIVRKQGSSAKQNNITLQKAEVKP